MQNFISEGHSRSDPVKLNQLSKKKNELYYML